MADPVKLTYGVLINAEYPHRDLMRYAGRSEELGFDAFWYADEKFYRVVIRTSKAELVAGGKAMPIIPGMIAIVEIKTGEKSVLSYLVKPLNKAREALRER